MRTLKKTLCLVLALVMVLGLGAVSVSAVEYEDGADITAAYEEAVQMLAGLNVMQGNGGNFLPKETLDRAAAAVILTKLALGGAEVPNMPASFKDVDESYAWASNYIGYAQAQGYIKGYNDDYFGPADKLTGAQWGIMLLRVVGYEDAKEDFSSGFELGVAKLVSLTKLAAGDTGFDVTQPITREEVAQLAYNSLFVPMVEYDTDLGATNGELNTVYKRQPLDGALQYLAEEKFNLTVTDAPTGTYGKGTLAAAEVKTGIITINAGVDTTYAKKTELAVITPNDDGTINTLATADYNFVSDLDQLGHIVTIYLDNNNKVVAVIDETTEDDIKTVAEDFTTSTTKYNAAFGKGTAVANNAVVFDDEYDATPDNADAFRTASGVNDDSDSDAANAGTYILYAGEIAVYFEPVSGNKVLSVVAAYTAPTESKTGSVTIKGIGPETNGEYVEQTEKAGAEITLVKVGDEEKEDIIELYDGIAVGDFVYVTIVGDNVAKVEPATVVTGVTVTSKSTTKVVAGESYDVAAADYGVNIAGTDTEFIDLGLTAVTGLTPGAEYNFVLTADGKLAGGFTDAEEEEPTTTHYGILLDYAFNAGSAANSMSGTSATAAYERIKVFTSEGKEEILDGAIKVNSDGTYKSGQVGTALAGVVAGETSPAGDNGTLVKYVLNEDGKVTEITKATLTGGLTGAYTKGNTFKVDNSGSLYANDKTVVFILKTTGSGTVKDDSDNDVKYILKADIQVYVGYTNVPGEPTTYTQGKAFDIDGELKDGGALTVTIATLPTPEAETTDASLVLLTGTAVQTVNANYSAALANGQYTYTYSAIIDGVEGSVFFNSDDDDFTDNQSAALAKGKLYVMTFDADTGALAEANDATYNTNTFGVAGVKITAVQDSFFVTTSPLYVDKDTVYYTITTTRGGSDAETVVKGITAMEATNAAVASTASANVYFYAPTGLNAVHDGSTAALALDYVLIYSVEQ